MTKYSRIVQDHVKEQIEKSKEEDNMISLIEENQKKVPELEAELKKKLGYEDITTKVYTDNSVSIFINFKIEKVSAMLDSLKLK